MKFLDCPAVIKIHLPAVYDISHLFPPACRHHTRHFISVKHWNKVPYRVKKRSCYAGPLLICLTAVLFGALILHNIVG